MSDLFETYEEEFNDLKLSVEQRIRNIPTFDARKCFVLNCAVNKLKELNYFIDTKLIWC